MRELPHREDFNATFYCCRRGGNWLNFQTLHKFNSSSRVPQDGKLSSYLSPQHMVSPSLFVFTQLSYNCLWCAVNFSLKKSSSWNFQVDTSRSCNASFISTYNVIWRISLVLKLLVSAHLFNESMMPSLFWRKACWFFPLHWNKDTSLIHKICNDIWY